jgi:EAL domain-containing protein (putative c-di-GMP-specific phosphodiesterase class I)
MLETELRRAIERNMFTLHYQPVISLHSNQISEIEALVRWEHPERGLVSPAAFIPVAEESGLILQLGQWVIEEACRQAVAWQQAYPELPPLTMGVNLSPRQFQDPQLVAKIERTLHESGLDPCCLKIEITERMMMQDSEITDATLRELKRLGVKLAIDDFGTGYCSLNYLKRFPVDTLKIDRSFINGLGHNTEDTAIVRAVIEFAKALSLNVTGEGIETAEQLAQLRDLECTRGQGYYFSKPLPSEAIGRLLGQSQQWSSMESCRALAAVV